MHNNQFSIPALREGLVWMRLAIEAHQHEALTVVAELHRLHLAGTSFCHPAMVESKQRLKIVVAGMAVDPEYAARLEGAYLNGFVDGATSAYDTWLHATEAATRTVP